MKLNEESSEIFLNKTVDILTLNTRISLPA